jgi:hypothetical protein
MTVARSGRLFVPLRRRGGDVGVDHALRRVATGRLPVDGTMVISSASGSTRGWTGVRTPLPVATSKITVAALMTMPHLSAPSAASWGALPAT